MASMIDKEWQDWTDKFLALGKAQNVQPMSPEQSKVFISMNFLERDEQGAKGVAADLNKDFLWNVIQKRADLYKLKYTIPMLVFVRFLCNSPGTAVMWVHALKRLEQKTPTGTVTLETLAHAFPVGFPKDADLHAMWDAQKGLGDSVDNYLDTVAP